MPRRTTKAKTAQKVLNDVLSPEDEQRLEELPLLLMDLNRQIKNTLEDFEEQSKSNIKAIKTRFMIGLSKIPPAMRNLPLESLAGKMNVPEEPEDDMGQVIDERVSTIKSTVKRSARKRKIESAQKPAPSTATRRSSRKRTLEETPVHGRQQQPMATPANSQYPANLGRTPFITPKFNTMTPLNRTVHRQAKPNEFLVSHSGSPVQATVSKPRGKKAAADTEGYMPLPLGGGLVLNLPVGSDDVAMDGLVLDDDQRQKVEQMRRMIDNVLKVRSSSTEESD